jgi:autotransporter-associated beta strand protein
LLNAATIRISGTVSPAGIEFQADGPVDLAVDSTTGGSIAIPDDGMTIEADGYGGIIESPITSGTNSIGLTVTGNGPLTLTGSNGFNGGTHIEQDAVVEVSSAASLGDGGLTLDDGTLDLNANSISVTSLAAGDGLRWQGSQSRSRTG